MYTQTYEGSKISLPVILYLYHHSVDAASSPAALEFRPHTVSIRLHDQSDEWQC